MTQSTRSQFYDSNSLSLLSFIQLAAHQQWMESMSARSVQSVAHVKVQKVLISLKVKNI
jgi:hypothetical protein